MKILRSGLIGGKCTVGVLVVFAVFWVGSVVGEDRPGTDEHRPARELMVRSQIAGNLFGREPVRDEAVLEAMRRVPRHLFVPEAMRRNAYRDTPLPIGFGQTISQPYIVGFMTEALGVDADDVVLEVGTGSGYQAAVLGEIVKRVYSIEIVEPLGKRSAALLKKLGYDNVTVKVGDGYKGWPEHGPFDAIIVTAAPDHVPAPLVEQLKVGGRMVIPVGPEGATQRLLVIEKGKDGKVSRREVMLVRFVPLTREESEDTR